MSVEYIGYVQTADGRLRRATKVYDLDTDVAHGWYEAEDLISFLRSRTDHWVVSASTGEIAVGTEVTVREGSFPV